MAKEKIPTRETLNKMVIITKKNGGLRAIRSVGGILEILEDRKSVV